MIRIAPFGKLHGIDAAELRIRDHFRGSPENADAPVFGLGPMRVLADTQISPQTGFPMHGYRDFEIVTYVCDGIIAHEDTTSAKGTLRMGDVQAMTTGSGVIHSESNPGSDPTRVYQMWFHADKAGLTPDYTDLVSSPAAEPAAFTVYALGAAHIDGLIRIRQDAAVMGASLQRGESILRELAPGRLAYLLAVDGPLAVNDSGVPQRGGVETRGESAIRIAASETPTRVLRIDVAENYIAPTG
jgi:redox-sensitive bicupin YhaK (pirin superfamily)